MVAIQQLNKIRDEVHALSLLVNDRTQLHNECNKLKKEIEMIQNEEKKYRKLTNQFCKKLIDRSIQLSDKAAFAQNHALSEKLQGLSTPDENMLRQSLSTPTFPSHNLTDGFMETIPEVNSSILSKEYDPNSIWKLQSQSTGKLHAKPKGMKTEQKYLARSFSMQEL